ncbi:unnamed protein product, partial [Nesidiocoris tenuis]
IGNSVTPEDRFIRFHDHGEPEISQQSHCFRHSMSITRLVIFCNDAEIIQVIQTNYPLGTATLVRSAYRVWRTCMGLMDIQNRDK